MKYFGLNGKVFVITGGGGMLGEEHAKAVAEFGGTPVVADLRYDKAREVASKTGGFPVQMDVCNPASCKATLRAVMDKYGRIDGLVNNAAKNPEPGDGSMKRFETLSLEAWDRDLSVGLKGAFVSSQVFGSALASQGTGTIVNVASDLGIIAPDQRIYRKPGIPDDQQPTKPVTYSVVKGGLIMLTKYLASYWADKGVRVNSVSPGGVYTNQDSDFVSRLTNLIPMGRMAKRDEYRGVIVFLCSDASSYMTGSNIVVDGGRTCW